MNADVSHEEGAAENVCVHGGLKTGPGEHRRYPSRVGCNGNPLYSNLSLIVSLVPLMDSVMMRLGFQGSGWSAHGH